VQPTTSPVWLAALPYPTTTPITHRPQPCWCAFTLPLPLPCFGQSAHCQGRLPSWCKPSWHTHKPLPAATVLYCPYRCLPVLHNQARFWASPACPRLCYGLASWVTAKLARLATQRSTLGLALRAASPLCWGQQRPTPHASPLWLAAAPNCVGALPALPLTKWQ
jgi:hypothetical protein